MDIAETRKKIINDLELLNDASSQCEYLMLLGMQWSAGTQIRKDCYRIGGCKTAIWLNVWRGADGVHFSGDSDSLLVKGILHIMDELYTRKSPQEIQQNPPDFLEYISDDVIYPEIKNNGISKCYQRLATLNV